MKETIEPGLVRSVLFVPATRAERIPKALASGADSVIIDLEDAVADADKAHARQALEQAMTGIDAPNLFLRMNAATSPYFVADLALYRRLPGLAGAMLAKAEDPATIESLAADGRPVWPLIESAAGIAALETLCVVPGVARLAFGALDLALDLGLEHDSDGGQRMLDVLRARLVLQSRLAGLAPPLAGVQTVIDAPETLARAARTAGTMGFGGMLCIHPKQIAPVHAAFMPSDAECAWAERVLERVAAGEHVFQLDDQMIDAPVIERARRIRAASQDA